MKIVLKENTVKISKVEPGQVFQHEGKYYICSDEEYTSINLDTGELVSFEGQEDVVLMLDAELHLNPGKAKK